MCVVTVTAWLGVKRQRSSSAGFLVACESAAVANAVRDQWSVSATHIMHGAKRTMEITVMYYCSNQSRKCT
jgi:hypothetical protein